ncbi:MAG: MGMT family protein [Candidatus Omnitrophica bacterium]|nr:MGMT family protein [Candidatus Omnitrophota bacterium]
MTGFEKRVLLNALSIPRGKVTTYLSIAKSLGTRAARAVGQALSKNPYAPNVPCHRVIMSDGRIGGYSGGGGVKRKADLLRREGHGVCKGRIRVSNQ